MESCNGVEIKTPKGPKTGRMVGATEDGRVRVRHQDGTESIVEPSQVEAVASSIRIPGTDIKVPLRFDGFVRLMLSKSNTVRKLTMLIGEDPMGGNGLNAMVDKDLNLFNPLVSPLLKTYQDAWGKYASDMSIPLLKRPAAEAEFKESIGRYIRGDEKSLPKNPEAAKAFKDAAEQVKKTFHDALELAKREGIEGTENIQFDAGYMTRSFNHPKMQRLISTYGIANIKEMFAQSIYKKRVGTTTLKEARVIADGYVNTITKLPYDNLMDDSIKFGVRDPELLKEKLVKELNLSDEVANEVADLLVPKKTGGREGFTKYKTLLDENFSMELTSLDKKTKKTVRLDEMFNNDAVELAINYANKIAGISALKRKGNLHEDRVWNKLLADAKTEYATAGTDPAKVLKEIEMLNGFRNYVLGRPMLDKPFGTFERVMRGVLSFNYIRFMGQAGFAQTAELGAIMGMFGTSATLKHAPAFKELLRTGMKGLAADDQLAKDLRAMGMTSGVEGLMPHSIHRKMEDGYHHPYMTKAENAMDTASNATSIISGMRATQEVFRRLSERALIQHLYDNAVAGKVSDMIKRMTASGIPESELTQTLEHVKKYFHTDSMGVVNHIDWERWVKENPETAAHFQLATYRESRRALMTYKPSELPWFMHSTTGKVLMQFRSFAMASHAKLFLNGLSHRDSVLATTAMLSASLGALSYTVQTMVNHAGDQEELDKRLTPQAILTSGIQRAGIFGMVPQGIDNMLYLTGQDTIFNGRTTQQASAGIMSNPTASTATSLGRLIHESMKDGFTSSEVTSKDVRNAQRMVANNLPMTMLGKLAAEAFPEKSNPVLGLFDEGDAASKTLGAFSPRKAHEKSAFGN